MSVLARLVDAVGILMILFGLLLAARIPGNFFQLTVFEQIYAVGFSITSLLTGSILLIMKDEIKEKWDGYRNNKAQE